MKGVELPASSSTASAPPGRYVPAIDGLRALAILAVLIYHWRPLYLPGGYSGVDVFFVISGFVVTGALARLREQGFSSFLANFYRARILRIMPALLLMLLVVAASTAYLVRGQGVEAVKQIGVPAFFALSNIALIASNDDYFSPAADYDPFLHTWTLGVEEQFYLVLPFLLYFVWRARRGGGDSFPLLFVGALCLGSLGLCVALSRADPDAAFYLMPTRFWELGAGAVLFLAAPRWVPVLQRSSVSAALLAAAALGALVSFWLFGGARAFPFPGALLPVCASAALIALAFARPGDLVPRLLSTRPALAVGLLSYSLYLWHWPVFVLMRWTVGIEGVPKGLAALGGAVAVSAASYLLVERPLRRSEVLRRLRFRTLFIGTAAATLLAAGAAGALVYGRTSFASRTADPSYWDGEPPPAGCGGRETRRAFADGEFRNWTSGCKPTGPVARLVVVGDSHAGGYAKMLRRYVVGTGSEVHLYTKNGCGYLLFGNPVSRAFDCRAFHAALEAQLPDLVRPGDVLFLPSIRVPHLIDSRTGLPSADKRASEADRARGRREAVAALRKITGKGVLVVFEAPRPLFNFVPIRCGDWFNARNLACRSGPDMPRRKLLEHRRAVVEDMAYVARAVPGVAVWDPFPALCPGDTCSPYRNGDPLFFDDNHLSGRGNDFLYPHFVEALHRQVEASRAGRS